MEASGSAWNLQRIFVNFVDDVEPKWNYNGTVYIMNDSGTPKRRQNNTEGHMTPVMAELPPPHWLPRPMPPPNGRYSIPLPQQTHQPLPYAQVAYNAQVIGMTDSELNILIEKLCNFEEVARTLILDE